MFVDGLVLIGKTWEWQLALMRIHGEGGVAILAMPLFIPCGVELLLGSSVEIQHTQVTTILQAIGMRSNAAMLLSAAGGQQKRVSPKKRFESNVARPTRRGGFLEVPPPVGSGAHTMRPSWEHASTLK